MRWIGEVTVHALSIARVERLPQELEVPSIQARRASEWFAKVCKTTRLRVGLGFVEQSGNALADNA